VMSGMDDGRDSTGRLKSQSNTSFGTNRLI
jgi:hypothetical protein